MIVSKLYGLQNSAQRFLLGRLYSRGGDSVVKFDKSRPPAKVLLVVAGLIGDSVMVTPGIIAARHAWPDAHITLLGKRHNSDLLEACPFIDEIHTVEIDPLTIRYRRKIANVKKWLAGQRFDVAILLLGNQYAHLLAHAEIPIRIGETGDLQAASLTHTYNVTGPREWGPSERLNSLRCLDYEIEDIPPRLWVSDGARENWNSKLSLAGLSREGYIILHPFGSERRKWWPLERVAEAAALICDEFGIKSLLVGGKETINVGECKSGRNDLLDLRGQLSLGELMAAIESAKVVISTDSGPFHLSGALNKRTIGLFRERSPEHSNRYPNASVILGQNTICSQKCGWDKCREVPCRQLLDISVDRLASEVHKQESESPIRQEL